MTDTVQDAPIALDDLLARLRARAADPERRTTARTSRLPRERARSDATA